MRPKDKNLQNVIIVHQIYTSCDKWSTSQTPDQGKVRSLMDVYQNQQSRPLRHLWHKASHSPNFLAKYIGAAWMCPL